MEKLSPLVNAIRHLIWAEQNNASWPTITNAAKEIDRALKEAIKDAHGQSDADKRSIGE
jgi:hypothetical protein